MAAFLSDTFTEASNTTLASHTPETGGAWAQHPNFTTNTITVGGGLGYCYGSSASGTSIYYNSASPPSADYYVECSVDIPASPTASATLQGLLARVQTGSSTLYQFFYNHSSSTEKWSLQKIVSGTTTTLDTDNTAITSGVPVTARLEVNGTSIKGFINGVEVCAATDSAISSAGFAGIRARSHGRVLSVLADGFGGSSSIATIANYYNRMRRNA